METLNNLNQEEQNLKFCQKLSSNFEQLLEEWDDDPRAALGAHFLRTLKAVEGKKWISIATLDERIYCAVAHMTKQPEEVIVDGD